MRFVALILYLSLAYLASGQSRPLSEDRRVVHELERMMSGDQGIPGPIEVSGAVSAESFVGDGSGITYTNTFWDDLTLSGFSLIDPAGPAGATLTPYPANTNVYVMLFKAGDAGVGQLQMSHTYARGTELRPHVHYSAAHSSTNVWRLDMAYGPILNKLTNHYQSVVTGTVASAYNHQMLSFAPLAGNTNTIGESTAFLIKVSPVSGSNTYLLDFDIHYQIDKLGSNNENPYE